MRLSRSEGVHPALGMVAEAAVMVALQGATP